MQGRMRPGVTMHSDGGVGPRVLAGKEGSVVQHEAAFTRRSLVRPGPDHESFLGMSAPPAHRPLGRLWTVRILPYGRPAAGIVVLECSGTGCAALGRERYRVPVQARKAALEHLAVHARGAAPVREQVACRCRAERCGWHTSPGHCGGTVCLAVVPDRLGRMWRLAEVCARCAAAIPQAKIVTAPPRQVTPSPSAPGPRAAAAGGVPYGFAAPAPAPRRNAASATAPQPTSGPAPRGRAPQGAAVAPARRAQHAAPTAQKPHQAPAASHGALATASGKTLLTAAQAVALRGLWDYLAARRPGSSTQARLLALVLTLRAARTGKRAGVANLLAQDLTGVLQLSEPREAVEDLVGCGWLRASAEEVLGAQEEPVACTVPDFEEVGSAPFTVSKTARPRLSGWVLRLLGHKRLRKQPAGVRLATAYLAAHASSSGAAEVDLVHLAAACQLRGPQEAGAMAAVLHEIGWLAEAASEDGRLRCRLAEEIRSFAQAPSGPSGRKPPAGQASMSGRERLVLARKTLGRGLSGDIERAVCCAVCAEEGVINYVPEAGAVARPAGLTCYAGRRSLSGRQAAVLQALLERVADTAPPSSSPSVRLAALWWAVRALWCGEVELSSSKLARIPFPGPRDALGELAAIGWLRADLEAVEAADDAAPALAVIPALSGCDPALWIGRESVTYLGAWLRRLLTHRLLAKAPAEQKLAAVYLTAHARPDRHVQIPLEGLVAATAADSPSRARGTADALHTEGWLSQPPDVADGALHTRLGKAAGALSSPSPAVYEPFGYRPVDDEVRAQAATLLEGRGAELARWVADYRVRHGHGPSWRILRNAHLEHDDPDHMDFLSGQAIRGLCEDGWLAGIGRPYGLQPGWRHHDTTTAPSTVSARVSRG